MSYIAHNAYIVDATPAQMQDVVRIEGEWGTPINTLDGALQHAKRDVVRRASEHLSSVYSITLFGDPAQPLC